MITKSATDEFESACYLASQPWLNLSAGTKTLTAAMIPAVPAPRTATCVFRQVVLGAKGVPKADITNDDSESTSAKLRNSWTIS